MSNHENHKLPFLMPDSFSDWDNVSVARAIAYTNVRNIAQHLNSRDNFEPEFSDGDIEKIQLYLYNDCLDSSERGKMTFNEFVGKK